MIRLLSTDFDGTLVDHFANPPVDPALFRMLEVLRGRGVHWAINTGRDLPFVDEGLREFGFPVEPDFVLTAEREVFHRGAGGGWEDFGDWNRRCYRAHDELFTGASGLLEDIARFVRENVSANPIYEGSRMVGLAAETEAEMDRICAFLEQERSRVPGFGYMRNTIYVRFCHEAYSKGTALAELARLMGISREEIFAAGDHYNDLPMLDGCFAKWVCCPGNAVAAVQESVRRAGGYVARGRCSTGVVEALEHFGVWVQG
jgi:hydroxymethylpyrimidine pyrophosphatase-like HAD family hydrolase